MPIYEYQCKACGAELEKLQKISEPLLVECPECGQPALVKQVSAPSFRLKGTGWYETDFKTGKKKLGTGDSEESRDTGKGSGEGAGDKSAAADSAKNGSGSGEKASAPAKDNNTGQGNSQVTAASAGNQS
jgi:putative FmdB family regulatory protein